jgi:hypothetical protein
MIAFGCICGCILYQVINEIIGGYFLKNGKIRIKTLVKFLSLVNLSRDRNRLLTVEEIVEEIHCCKGHAYNYLRALDKLLSSLIV